MKIHSAHNTLSIHSILRLIKPSLTCLALVGWCCALLCLGVNLFPLPTNAFELASPEWGLWTLKALFGLGACFGNYVTYVALKRLPKMLEGKAWLVSPLLGVWQQPANQPMSTKITHVIKAEAHGWGKNVNVELTRNGFPMYPGEVTPKVNDTGDVELHLGDGRGSGKIEYPPGPPEFCVRITRKAIF